MPAPWEMQWEKEDSEEEEKPSASTKPWEQNWDVSKGTPEVPYKAGGLLGKLGVQFDKPNGPKEGWLKAIGSEITKPLDPDAKAMVESTGLLGTALPPEFQGSFPAYEAVGSALKAGGSAVASAGKSAASAIGNAALSGAKTIGKYAAPAAIGGYLVHKAKGLLEH